MTSQPLSERPRCSSLWLVGAAILGALPAIESEQPLRGLLLFLTAIVAQLLAAWIAGGPQPRTSLRLAVVSAFWLMPVYFAKANCWTHWFEFLTAYYYMRSLLPWHVYWFPAAILVSMFVLAAIWRATSRAACWTTIVATLFLAGAWARYAWSSGYELLQYLATLAFAVLITALISYEIGACSADQQQAR